MTVRASSTPAYHGIATAIEVIAPANADFADAKRGLDAAHAAIASAGRKFQRPIGTSDWFLQTLLSVAAPKTEQIAATDLSFQRFYLHHRSGVSYFDADAIGSIDKIRAYHMTQPARNRRAARSLHLRAACNSQILAFVGHGASRLCAGTCVFYRRKDDVDPPSSFF